MNFFGSSISGLVAESDAARGFTGSEGARLSYLIAGDSQRRSTPPILLIHGSGMSAGSWTYQLRGLAPAMRVMAIDLPGHGESDSIAEVTVDSYADAASRLLNALGIRSVFVAGHSLGGGVAIALAARRPRLVKGLLLLSSCAKLPQTYTAFENAFRSLPSPVRKFFFFSSAKRILFPLTASVRAVQLGLHDLRSCRPETVHMDTAAAKAMDLEVAARELRLPVRILCGTRDMVTPVALSQRLSELIPGAQLNLVRGAGHMLPLEAPERINQEISEFVQGVVDGAVSAPAQLAQRMKRALGGQLLGKIRALFARNTDKAASER